MGEEGPVLEGLTRRLAECPADFLLEPQIGRQGVVCVAAVVADLLRELGAPSALPNLPQFEAKGGTDAERNRLQVVLVASWLLYRSLVPRAPRGRPAGLSVPRGGADGARAARQGGKAGVRSGPAGRAGAPLPEGAGAPPRRGDDRAGTGPPRPRSAPSNGSA